MNPIYCGVSDQFAGHGAGYSAHVPCQAPAVVPRTMAERLAFWRSLYAYGDETVTQDDNRIIVTSDLMLTGVQSTVVEIFA